MTDLILGAGYIGARLAELAIESGREVVLADNWFATEREQVEALGAQTDTVDIRSPEDLARVVPGCERVFLLAAQASRPLSISHPDYTEETNLTGARRVAEAVAGSACRSIVYGSSLHVYGSSLEGEIGADHPYGPQGDLSHLSKIYAELCLDLYARRHGFELSLLRLGIVYGPSPVMHERPESQTVVDKFKRLAAAGEELPLDDGGRATIGVVHVDDVAKIMLDAPQGAANVAAETVTVADVAALARGEEPGGGATHTFASPFEYRYSLAEYMR
ncbi:MAG TPA: NAD-dependent epimerase/dehydratase family protein [Thermoleophilaceae bacterium]